MNAWRTDFQVRGGLASLPQLLRVGWATVTATSGYTFMAEARRGFPYCTFQFTLKGAGHFADRTGSYEVGPGHGFLFSSTATDWRYGYPARATAPWEFVYAEFSGGNLLEVAHELTAGHGPVFALAPDGLITRKLLGFSNTGWKTVAVGAAESAELCLGLVLKLVESTRPPGGGTHGPLIESALALIENRLDRNLAVDEIADALSVSREHFTRVFHREMGLSPHRYIVQQRIRLACHLLRSTTLSCQEIADRVGDSSPAHFNRQFRQLTGATPKAFRDRKIVHPLF